jgi:aldose 1-epimerase
MAIEKQGWGSTPDGQAVSLYTLTNANGMVAKISDYGGIVVSLMVLDRDGKMADVVLGFDTIDEYVKDSPDFGCITGRYANRICKGKFTLEGVEYSLDINNGPNALHGGLKGFDKVVWDCQTVETADGPAMKLSHVSGDGDQGFPGELTSTVTYTLTDDNELRIEYSATTDKTTILNLTNHSYFNLAGHGAGDVLSHEMMIDADYFTPVDEHSIPTGELKAVDETAMDFNTPITIGSRIDQVAGGYDHNYILKNTDGSLVLAARTKDPSSGRVMETFTTEPGVQLYTANYLDSSIKGKGAVYGKQHGFCLETQHWPDSPNQEEFPSVILEPGEKYTQTTIYKFSVE